MMMDDVNHDDYDVDTHDHHHYELLLLFSV